MASTRSSARLASRAASTLVEAETEVVASKGKRKSSNAAPKTPAAKKSKTTSKAADAATPQPRAPLAVISSTVAVSGTTDTPVPAVLTFDFEEAMQHLIDVDSRFQDLFDKMPCKPFEHLEQLHPFRALAISILGQQISWRAARSITHKFIRMWNPDIAEEVTDESREAAMKVFPSPEQVSQAQVAQLRTAGLSERKAQYIQDLASRFADGRLSTDKLLKATDDELAEMLIDVKGIGRVIDMFAIFSLHRPDILPVGDLGVQRGMARWFLALHSPAHPYMISPEKVDTSTPRLRQKKNGEDDALPVVGTGNKQEGDTVAIDAMVSSADTSLLPPSFTPSIAKTLEKPTNTPTPLPGGITTSLLKGRLGGQKVK
ncbi:DNA glycosylase [Coprinopsis sp. MPI-PUGE-AT-0042]|nr:DNA glycosylase [Coprinopsis sp. MPI-PUGE-AT-0042]